MREKKAKSSSGLRALGSEADDDLDDDPEEGGLLYPQPGDEEPGDSDEEEKEGGVEVWRRKKIGWLCKEIPVLRPTGIVTLLNSQRKWIQAVDTKEVMEALMRRNEILRAHRVGFFCDSSFFARAGGSIANSQRHL